ncbi:hypothetical protein D9M69_599750 [compost metagenome]
MQGLIGIGRRIFHQHFLIFSYIPVIDLQFSEYLQPYAVCQPQVQEALHHVIAADDGGSIHQVFPDGRTDLRR